MLTWEECLNYSQLTQEEEKVLARAYPSRDVMKFILSPYMIEIHLKRTPAVKDYIIDDIIRASAAKDFGTSAALKAALKMHLNECEAAKKGRPGFKKFLPALPITWSTKIPQ